MQAAQVIKGLMFVLLWVQRDVGNQPKTDMEIRHYFFEMGEVICFKKVWLFPKKKILSVQKQCQGGIRTRGNRLHA